MHSLQECQLIINRYLNEIDLPELPSNLYEPVRYMLCLGAKRLRPSMVIMGCNVFSDNVEPAIYPALAIEVFHNFTLVHDDIMDNSDMRRNKPTVHIKWSRNVAILSGDAMVIKAYELLALTQVTTLSKILPLFNQTALQVCEGQQFDMDFEDVSEISIEQYLKMIELKTAVLLAASLKIGALAGGATNEESDFLYEFGRNIGIAFQLQDDLLDVFADATVFGKVTGNDIVSNKKTILLTEALNKATANIKNELLKWLKIKEFERLEKINAIRSVYSALQIEQKVKDRIVNHYNIATRYLENLNLDPARKAELIKLSAYLLNRKK